jgi:hypothetical protein
LPAPADFIAVNRLIGLILDPRIARKTLRELREAVTASNTAREALQRERQSFEEHARKTTAELEERTKAAAAREVAAHLAEEGVRDREHGLIEQSAELRRQDTILRRRVIVLARLDAPGPLQDMPSWRQIAAELLAVEDNPEPEMDTVIVRPDGMPPNVSLTRSVPTGRRSARRGAEA